MPAGTAPTEAEESEAAAGGFGFWSSYGRLREAVLFHRLRTVLATAPFDEASADALRDGLSALAAERGRSEAEMFDAVGGGLPHDYVEDDPVLSRRLRELVEDPSRSRYFALVAKSVSLLARDHLFRDRRGHDKWYGGFQPRPRPPNRDLSEWMRTKGSIDVEMVSAFRLAARPIMEAAGFSDPTVRDAVPGTGAPGPV